MQEKFLEKKFELNLTLKREQTCLDLTHATAKRVFQSGKQAMIKSV